MRKLFIQRNNFFHGGKNFFEEKGFLVEKKKSEKFRRKIFCLFFLLKRKYQKSLGVNKKFFS